METLEKIKSLESELQQLKVQLKEEITDKVKFPAYFKLPADDKVCMLKSPNIGTIIKTGPVSTGITILNYSETITTSEYDRIVEGKAEEIAEAEFWTAYQDVLKTIVK